MAWAQFLRNISNESKVTIVGPLLHQPHQALMPTIYVDGGSDFRKDGGWAAQDQLPSAFPVISVGDGDSACGKLDEVLPASKDYSDLAFVLRSLPPTIHTVDMLGFLGERRDHELANLGEVHQFLRTRSAITTVHIFGQPDQIVAFSHGRVELLINGLFSVMVFEPEAIRISGACDYKLAGDVVLPVASSVGLSNRAHGLVSIETVKPCFVFLPA